MSSKKSARLSVSTLGSIFTACRYGFAVSTGETSYFLITSPRSNVAVASTLQRMTIRGLRQFPFREGSVALLVAGGVNNGMRIQCVIVEVEAVEGVEITRGFRILLVCIRLLFPLDLSLDKRGIILLLQNSLHAAPASLHIVQSVLPFNAGVSRYDHHLLQTPHLDLEHGLRDHEIELLHSKSLVEAAIQIPKLEALVGSLHNLHTSSLHRLLGEEPLLLHVHEVVHDHYGGVERKPRNLLFKRFKDALLLHEFGFSNIRVSDPQRK